MEPTTEVGFFREQQIVAIPTVVKVKVSDLVNLIFGSGLYTLSWWGDISFGDKNGNVDFDEIDSGKFDAETLTFYVEFQDEDDTNQNALTLAQRYFQVDSNKPFFKRALTLSCLVDVISANPTFANDIATEDVDVWSADAILQKAIYGKVVWG